ncbi:Glycosyltransferase involved in cell wall bisynthesis [Nitrosospira sp. Nsp11]|uniref:glycosyltransferase n=1 Tax=unclassified Nitrosospira TaxID=2609267 RepID=UPI000882DA07|nr:MULTISPECIES: glycosyltransferase [unclassified Nitrosospira]SDA10706.1 Glycosyltransferase involved in cell wall bisynthesis [Nitrosospira sp. Nsp18]SHL16418.1 Glycosyltransferase involved in cell wall bisynthesis [Nitrosospira sp. Nsp11]
MKIISTTERPINLLQIIGGSIVGGMENYVLRLLQRLPGDAFHVTCLCIAESRFTAQLRDIGCSVHTTPMTDEPEWQSLQLGVSLIRAEAIDVIHAHLPNAHLLAGILGRITERPALATIHGRYLHIRDFEVHKLMQTHICVVAKSAYFHALNLGVPASKLRFIANGVDTEIFHPMAKTDYLHSIINVSPATPLIGFIGRLSHEKGPEVFVQVASMVHKKCEKYHFVLVGDGPMRQKLKDDIDNMGLNGYVHMAGLQSDMPQVYSSLDLVVSTSYSEAMPLAIIEAMASGLPVIATNVGGVIDIVEVGRTGLLNGVGDLNGMANNIVTMMSDESARIEMGKAARKRTEANFELTNSVGQTSELLSSLTQIGYQGERSIGQY